MRKKILKRIGYVLGIVLASVLVAFGAMFLFVRYRVEKTGNVLGVSWYNETDKEFTIDTVEEFYEFAKLSTYYNFEEQTVKLGTDLVINKGNAKEWEESTPKNKWSAIDGFAGTFDGQGHTISGLYAKGYNSPTALFVNTTKGCEIRNFKITNSYFEGKGVGGVASVVSNGGANLKQIYSDAIINVKGTWSGYAGGICSKLTAKSTLEECWFDGVINNTGRNSGGIVDDVNRCEVQLLHCLFSGDINSTWSVAIDNASHYYLSRTGGLVGRAINDGARLVINDCLSSGNITAEYVNQTGGVLGTAMKGSTLICNDTFAVSGQYAPVGSSGSQGTMQSLPLESSRERLIGNKAYQWTSLDFENYWSVVEEDTPILKCFSENSPSLEGLQKAYDTSWYSETASESVIMTPEQLYGFYFLSSRTDFAGKTIKLGADIILNKGKATTWNAENAPENTWVPIGKFTGIFDGQGHTISGLYISLAGRNSVGLFAAADVKSEIKDLNLKNSYIQGKDSVGSVVGTGGGTFTNVRSNAILVAEEKAGGIIGLRDAKVATLTNCTYSGTVSATGNNVGGLIGLVNGKDHTLTIQNSTFAGKVHTTADQAGGLIGGLGGYSDVVITGCKATGTVAADNMKAGGFIGTIAVANKVSISKSSSGATVTVGDKQAGGFIGYTTKETELSQVEFSGKVTGVQQLGGLVGMIYKTDVTAKNANVTGTVSATGNNVGGMIGLLNGEGRKLTISNSTFAGNVHTTADQAGGLIGGVGGKSDVVITGCKAAGTVAADKTRAGGFIGTIAVANKVSISKSLSQTTVTTGDKQSGGFVGYTEREIAFSQVQFSGKASGLQQIGGLIGAIRKTKVTAEDVLITGTLHSTRDTEAESRVGGLFGIIADGKPEVTVTRALITGDITYVTNHEGDCGEQVGHIQKDATYIATGVYAREGSCASGKMIGKGSATKLTQCVTMPAIFLQGATAVDTASLLEISTDAKKLGTWVAIETSYPALRIFTDQKHVLSGNSVVSLVDKSWYDSNKNEFVLTDSADLYGFTFLSKDTDFSGKTIKLGASITLNEGDAKIYETKAPAMPWISVSKFAGTIDGQGNSIKGVYISSGDKVGLFSETTEKAVIKNLSLKESYINGTGANGTGSIVGRGGGTFEAIYSDAIVKSEKTKVGGIIGYIVSDTTMNQVQFAGMTAANNQTGGLAATVKDANVTLTDCLVTGTVSTTETATGKHMNAGLLVGMIDANSDVAAIRCLAAGYLKPALVSSSNYARALVGKVTGNNALFHGENVVIADDESYVQEENRGYIGILNPTTDEVAKYTDCGWKGKAGSGIKRLTIENMTGINALYNISGFEFCANAADSSKTWVAMTDGEPQLRIFADVAQTVDLYPHIGWYAYAAEGVGASEENPYKISTIDQLKALVYFVNQGDSFEGKYIQLDAANNELVFNTDAPSTLSEWEAYIKESAPAKFAPIGTSETPFKGQFDGNGCTIKGLYVEPGSSQAAGFFGVTGETATIKNLTITNSYIQGTSSDGTGSIVGRGGGTFEAIYSDAVVESEKTKVGGIIGYIVSDTTMNQVQFAGMTAANNQTGGLAATVKGANVTLTDCLVTGTVSTTETATGKHMNAGLLVGMIDANSDVAAIRCLAAGYLKPALVSSSNYARALVGKVTRNNALFHGESVVIIDNTDHIQTENRDYIGVLNPKTDGVATYTNCGWKGKGGSGIKRLTIENMTGINALYNISGFEFCANAADSSKTWVAMTDGEPQLRIFADAAQIADLYPHIGWYAYAAEGVGASEGNPYKISTIDQLKALVYFVNQGDSFEGKYIQLDAANNELVFNTDAPSTLSEWEAYIKESAPAKFAPIGTSETPFKGQFDGNGCTIKGLYVEPGSSQAAGFFGVTGETATIKNLTITNSYIQGTSSVGTGSVVGEGGGTFTNVHSSAVVTSENGKSGGIIGEVLAGCDTTITDSSYSGYLESSKNNNGGMVGLMSGSAKGGANTLTITDCEFTGSVDGTQVGGFVGGVGAKECTVRVTGCTSSGVISGTNDVTGGIIGKVAATYQTTISECTVNGTVKAQGDPELYVGETHKNYTDKVTLSKNSSIGAVLMDLTSELSKHMDWYAKAENGVGDSESNPYKIAKTEELNTLAYFVNKGISFKNKYIQLTAEKLDFNEAAPNTLNAWKEYIKDKSPTAFTPIGTGTNPFDGNFDGNECTISGIYISKDKTNGVGLFGVTVGGGKISDLTLTSSYIVGQKYVGSIVGQSNGRFNNVHSDAVIIAQECAGGILGQQKDGSAVNMENCSYDGELSATGNNVGGMLGLLPNPQDVSFTNCEFTGNVHTTGAQAGGFIGGVGAKAEINITGCKSTGSVHADGELNKDKTETLGKAGGYIGIIAVAATIKIENSVSNATVTTDGTKAGGYIGYNQSGKKVTILNSTSGANVTATGKQAGGFVGMTDKPLDITNSQFTGTVTGLQHVAGFIGAANNTKVNITDGLMAGIVRASLTISDTQGSSLGGLVGIIVNNNANITATRCMIAGTISSATADDDNVGEHVGRMDKGIYTAVCVYVQKGCCVAETEVGYKAKAATKDIRDTCDRLTEVELKGDAATNKAGGLFGENSLWTTRLVGHPVLKDYHWYYANTSAKEFVIDEAIELFELAQLAKTVSFGDKTIYLGQDIVLNTNTVTRATDTDTTNDPVAWTPIGTSSNPFAGTFDGQNHTISGLYVNSGNSNYQGLFAFVGNCTIQKFNISDSYIKGQQNVGSVVGGVYTSTLATIKNITSSAYLVSTSIQMGGMVGLVSDRSTTVNIENCTFSGTLNTSFNNIGGMVGLVSAKTGSSLNITNCDFTGNMSGGQIGGMIGGVGDNEATVTLTGCQINGSINGSSAASNVGGLIGKVALTKSTEIKGCTVQGQVMKNNVAVATKTFIGNIPDTYKDKVIVSDDNTWSANVSTE